MNKRSDLLAALGVFSFGALLTVGCAQPSTNDDPGTGGTGNPGSAGTTGAAGSNPQGAAGSNPQGAAGSTGVAGSNPQGAAGSNPQGAAGSNPQGVAGSTGKGGTTGVAGSNPQGAAGSNPQGVAGSSGGSTGTAGSGPAGSSGTAPAGYWTSGSWHGCAWTGIDNLNMSTTTMPMDFTTRSASSTDPYCIKGSVGPVLRRGRAARLQPRRAGHADPELRLQAGRHDCRRPARGHPHRHGHRDQLRQEDRRHAAHPDPGQGRRQGGRHRREQPLVLHDHRRQGAGLRAVQRVQHQVLGPHPRGQQEVRQREDRLGRLPGAGRPQPPPRTTSASAASPPATTRARRPPAPPARAAACRAPSAARARPTSTSSASRSARAARATSSRTTTGVTRAAPTRPSPTTTTASRSRARRAAAPAPACRRRSRRSTSARTATPRTGTSRRRSDDNLPKQVSTIGSVQTKFTWSGGGGNYNASYDVWFSANKPAGRYNDGISGFVMVWLYKPGQNQPIGSVARTASIAGKTWDVWVGKRGGSGSNANAPVVSYVAQGGSVNTLTLRSEGVHHRREPAAASARPGTSPTCSPASRSGTATARPTSRPPSSPRSFSSVPVRQKRRGRRRASTAPFLFLGLGTSG